MTLRAPDLFAALEAGVPLLTATQRLAREWRWRYDAAQHARGRAVWESADVLPLGAWVRRQFEEALDAGALGLGPPGAAAGARGAESDAPGGALLSETQAAAVWERIVLASPLARDLARGGGLAARAREAWRRLAEWRLPLPLPDAGAALPVEQRAFGTWAAEYAATCRRRGWADPAELPTRVAGLLRAGALAPPPRVLVAGFDDVSPQTAHLLAALREAGATVDALPLPERARTAVRTAAPHAEAEALAAARWARHWREREPAARIGIVVPELRERRAQLLRVLEDVLTPGAVLPGAEPGERPFELSAGLALSDYPLVAAALALLALTPAAQPLEAWSTLLRCPFLAGAEREADSRARLDVRLRAWGAAELTAARLSTAAGEHGAPLLAAALGRWRGAWDALPRPPQAPSAWAVACDGLLRALGWPGERTPDSAEFQTREKWHGVLEELARLDPVLPPLPHGEALALLRRLAGEAEFQPQGAEASVQVLGVLESGGLEFDHLWVLGLHEELWPPAPRPNPFLPLELQRRHGLPRASVARELEIARRETTRLLQSAPDVVFSHAAWDGDRPLRPSPLIRAVPWAAPDTLPPAPGAAGLTLREAIGIPLPAPEGLEALRDDAAPPVAGDGPVPGGTGVFTDQAACPFRAFARHRLHARAPERPEPGLDAAERGTLVHGVLERAWRRIRDHATLHALDAEALGAVLDEAVEGTLAHFAEAHRDRLGPRLRALERRRLLGLARDWLALERERAPFAVELMEEPQPLEIGGISVRGRVDRIDRLPDGARVLIDYKTGATRLSAWWGERPDEPQLPLYAASGGLPLAGVAFAQVRRQELTFRGVADDPARFPRAERFDKVRLPPGTAPYASWAAVVEHWRAALERLAAAFRAGDARVDPKRGDTCAWCDLPGLCRIAEVRGTLGAAAAADPDGAGEERGGEERSDA